LKLLIAGGGTGGHVFPALAVARVWLSRSGDREAVFVGTERGLEMKLIRGAGLKLETIRSAGLKGMGAIRFARNFAKLGPALLDSAAILRRDRYAAVFGVGGYAAGPVMLMARMRGLPTVIFEPNAEPGFTNRVLASMVDRIAAGYPAVSERLGRRATLTGCPVRPEFFACSVRFLSLPYRVLITGGSQGSHRINQAVMDALPLLVPHASRLAIVHQTGERDHEAVGQAYRQHGIAAEVSPFLTGMPEQFAQADLIVCRSGAITVAEIAAAGRAALFIPFGAATDSHQLRNAEEMVRAGAARLIPEPELSGTRLARELLALIEQPETLSVLGARAKQLARPRAAEDIADMIEEVAVS
jgi:UDP-N-acetylglucosamine--N-acetylmuramyl-(pentapeptide) pyrophosphoryl-undecaprenol N-acetylglucosamine transferase